MNFFRLLAISAFILFSVELHAELFIRTNGTFTEGKVLNEQFDHILIREKNKKVRLDRSDLVAVVKDHSYRKKKIVYYKDGSIQQTYVLYADVKNIYISDNLDESRYKIFPRDRVKAIGKKRVTCTRPDTSSQIKTPLKRFYFLFNPGGALVTGPELEFGLHLGHNVLLGLFWRYKYLALVQWLVDSNGMRIDSAENDPGNNQVGIRLGYAFPLRKSNDRIVLTTALSFAPYFKMDFFYERGDVKRIEYLYPVFWTVGARYRMRLRNSLFFDFGLEAGVMFVHTQNITNLSRDESSTLDKLYFYIESQAIIAVGVEF